MYTWKKRNGSKATYAKLIKIFEQSDCKSYADKFERIASISNYDTDDFSASEEEHPQIKQPQTYPDYKPHALPQVPQATSESTEVYVMVDHDEENLPEGMNYICNHMVQDYNTNW